ncbi:hypothetical protein PRNP1_009165 [Phytophthora ramorum]
MECWAELVDLYLVTDRSSATASTGSLDVTLYGEEHVVLQTAELSSEILQKRISKVTLTLDTEAAIKTVKIQAAARISLQIFEVQTSVNDLPPTIFSPPTPGSVTFVGSEETTSTGIVSLWFVPVTEYLKGAYRSQCLFDLVGRCGYHADLQESSDLLFLSEEGNELIVAAKSVAAPSFRPLSCYLKRSIYKMIRRFVFCSSSLISYDLHFCEVTQTNGSTLVVRKGEKIDILPAEFAQTILGVSLHNSQLITSITLVMDADLLPNVGTFEIDGHLAQLQGNSTLSFSYQLSSDFSSISTDVILNSSETRRVWSSESAAINPSGWNIAVAPITLAYASTAEIIFRGVVAVEDVLYLKTISLRDYTQESTVGVVEYIRATGGMIYFEVNTAESIPEPVWYRVYVKTLNSNESPALRFTGDGLQYLGANDEVAVLTNGVKVADGRLSKDNCNIPAYAYLQLGRDTMDIRSDASVLQGAMDEVRIWKVARDTLAVNASYQSNIADTDLILRLPFNSAEKTNWFPSGTDESGNSVDFMVQNVSVINTRLILAFGVAGDGSCFYKLTSAEVDVLPASTCDKACGDGSMKTCGSSISSKLHVVTSVYGKGPLGVGGLSPLVDYDIYVEFVSEDGGEYDITGALIASTSNTTVPGKVEYISVVERSDQSLEIRWSPVDDNGGSVILSYLVFMNGVQMEGTSDGTTLSVTLSIPEMQTSYNVTVQARNAFGLGPYSDSLLLAGVYSEPSPEIPQRPNISFVSGGTVELVLDDTTVSAVDKLLSVVVIEHREISLTFFTKSFYRRNGTSATVYKLRHNTAYVFRIALASKSGIQSAFSIPISVRTGNRGMPRKTPVPLAPKATGGSITLTMEEPLDTGNALLQTTSRTTELWRGYRIRLLSIPTYFYVF